MKGVQLFSSCPPSSANVSNDSSVRDPPQQTGYILSWFLQAVLNKLQQQHVVKMMQGIVFVLKESHQSCSLANCF